MSDIQIPNFRRCANGKCAECGEPVQHDDQGWFCTSLQCWRMAYRKLLDFIEQGERQ